MNLRTTTLLALAAGAFLVASPALAWTCTAKNARGANYTAVAVVKATAKARALRRCRKDSAVPRTCYIVRCKLP